VSERVKIATQLTNPSRYQLGSGVFKPFLCLIFIRWQYRELMEYLQDSADAIAVREQAKRSGVPPMRWEDFMRELEQEPPR
jgi:hypothetical protein